MNKTFIELKTILFLSFSDPRATAVPICDQQDRSNKNMPNFEQSLYISLQCHSYFYLRILVSNLFALNSLHKLR